MKKDPKEIQLPQLNIVPKGVKKDKKTKERLTFGEALRKVAKAGKPTVKN